MKGGRIHQYKSRDGRDPDDKASKKTKGARVLEEESLQQHNLLEVYHHMKEFTALNA